MDERRADTSEKSIQSLLLPVAPTDTDLLEIESALQHLNRREPAFYFAVSVGHDPCAILDPAEDVYTNEMTFARRQEFAAGRAAARRALATAGVDRPIVLADHQGVPLFPGGHVGSIAHKYGRAVAVVAPGTAIAGIGIDLEFDEGEGEADLRCTVTTGTEAASIVNLARAERGLASPTTLLLSAKEAAYKAVFPRLRNVFDFEDLELSFDPRVCAFGARRFPGEEELSVRGHYARVERWIVCIAVASNR